MTTIVLSIFANFVGKKLAKTSLFGRSSFRFNDASSTVTTISNGCEEGILNKFLYPKLTSAGNENKPKSNFKKVTISSTKKFPEINLHQKPFYHAITEETFDSGIYKHLRKFLWQQSGFDGLFVRSSSRLNNASSTVSTISSGYQEEGYQEEILNNFLYPGLTSADDNNKPKLKVKEVAAGSTIGFLATDLHCQVLGHAIKKQCYNMVTSKHPRKLLCRQSDKKRICRSLSLRLNDESSTLSTISSRCEEKVLINFLFFDLISGGDEYKPSFEAVVASSADEFPRGDQSQKPFYPAVENRSCYSNGSNHWLAASMPKKRKSILFGKFSSYSIPASSTVSAMSSASSSACEEDIRNQFLYSELINCKRKTTEAHSIMLQQMQQCVLGMNGNVNNVEAAGISETSLLDKKGAIYIAGCELDFPEGSFQTDVVAKLSCFYPLQASYDDGIIISPEIEVAFADELMKPFSITMPTCYSSTDYDNAAQITTQLYNADGEWRIVDVKASLLNRVIKFETNKPGRFRCVVMDREYLKLSKEMFSMCFLKRSEDSDRFGIVWYLADDWQHLESRVRLEMSPETVYEHIFFVNLSDVKFGTSIHLSINEGGKFSRGKTVVFGNETLWKSFLLTKIKFDVKNLKKIRFAITDNHNKLIYDHVQPYDA